MALAIINHPILDAHQDGNFVTDAVLAKRFLAEHVSDLLRLHVLLSRPGSNRKSMPSQFVPELLASSNLGRSCHLIPFDDENLR
jgi:hypothetical protein